MPIDEVMLERMLGDRWQEKLPPICPECGYNLTGLPDNRCPECGYVYSRRDVRRNAQMMLGLVRRLKGVNDVTNVGLLLAIGGLAFLGVAKLAEVLNSDRAGMLSLARVIGIFVALPSIGLGLQVFRVKRLPAWARQFVPIRPQYNRGGIVVILGAALIVTCLLLP